MFEEAGSPHSLSAAIATIEAGLDKLARLELSKLGDNELLDAVAASDDSWAPTSQPDFSLREADPSRCAT